MFCFFFLSFRCFQNSVLGLGLVRYWLLDLLKHEYIALRFLAQASYEQAATPPTTGLVAGVFSRYVSTCGGWWCLTSRLVANNSLTTIPAY